MNPDQPPPYSGTDPNAGKHYGGSPNDTVCAVQGEGSYQHATLIISEPRCTIAHEFRETPLRIQCQFCLEEVVTTISYDSGTLTWLLCFIIFWFCPLGCCLIPFFVLACMDVVHQCPNCLHHVGRYNRL